MNDQKVLFLKEGQDNEILKEEKEVTFISIVTVMFMLDLKENTLVKPPCNKYKRPIMSFNFINFTVNSTAELIFFTAQYFRIAECSCTYYHFVKD